MCSTNGIHWLVVLLSIRGSSAFSLPAVPLTHYRPQQNRHSFHPHDHHRLPASLGDFTVELEKPLGILLEERTAGAKGGVRVKEMNPLGSASQSRIVPGDILLQINNQDVTESDFDTVMGAILSSPPIVRITLGDGLGTLDMPKNVVAMLKSSDEAFFMDAVVRAAVRDIRRHGRLLLGDLNKVEVIIGAGVRDNGTRGMARFFAIFSTDGVSTYSCNVAATGVRQDDGSIKIVSLSCAKDEGLGQTYDLIREVTETP